MRKQITVVFLLCVFLLTGCDDANSTEVQQTLSSEQTEESVSEEIKLEETNVMEGESVSEEITTEQEDLEEEESVTSSEHIAEEATIEEWMMQAYKPRIAIQEYQKNNNILVEEIVYDENDVVFVIAKRPADGEPIFGGFLISAGGDIASFRIAYDDFFTEEIVADFGNILDMENVEPVMELSLDTINQYIDKFKNIDENNENEIYPHDIFDYEFEHILIYGRKVDCDKNVEYVTIYAISDIIYNPTDSKLIELKNWLIDLNQTLTEMTEEK